MPSVIIFLQGCAIVIGLLLLYIAFLLYEDEQGKLQDRLENIWVFIESRREEQTSAFANFFSGVAVTINNILDKLFGKKLFSISALYISVLLGLSSISMFGLKIKADDALRDFGYNIQHPLNEHFVSVLICLVGVILPLYLARSFYKQKNKTVNVKFLLVINGLVILVFSGLLAYLVIEKADFDDVDINGVPLVIPIAATIAFSIFVVSGAIAAGYFWDFVTIATIRYIFIKTSETRNSFSMLLLLLGVGLLSLLFVFSVYGIGFITEQYINKPGGSIIGFGGIYIFVISVIANLYNFLISILLFLLALLLIIHRMLSPLLSRILYAVAEHRIIREKKILGVTGLGLLIYGIPAIKDVGEFIIENWFN
jgi:hypothetical protein